jgi:hypothetical protein
LADARRPEVLQRFGGFVTLHVSKEKRLSPRGENPPRFFATDTYATSQF